MLRASLAATTFSFLGAASAAPRCDQLKRYEMTLFPLQYHRTDRITDYWILPLTQEQYESNQDSDILHKSLYNVVVRGFPDRVQPRFTCPYLVGPNHPENYLFTPCVNNVTGSNFLFETRSEGRSGSSSNFVPDPKGVLVNIRLSQTQFGGGIGHNQVVREVDCSNRSVTYYWVNFITPLGNFDSVPVPSMLLIRNTGLPGDLPEDPQGSAPAL